MQMAIRAVVIELLIILTAFKFMAHLSMKKVLLILEKLRQRLDNSRSAMIDKAICFWLKRQQEEELVKKIASEKDAMKKERFKIELLEVRGFRLELDKIKIRLEAVISVMPKSLLGGGAEASSPVVAKPAVSSPGP